MPSPSTLAGSIESRVLSLERETRSLRESVGTLSQDVGTLLRRTIEGQQIAQAEARGAKESAHKVFEEIVKLQMEIRDADKRRVSDCENKRAECLVRLHTSPAHQQTLKVPYDPLASGSGVNYSHEALAQRYEEQKQAIAAMQVRMGELEGVEVRREQVEAELRKQRAKLYAALGTIILTVSAWLAQQVASMIAGG